MFEFKEIEEIKPNTEILGVIKNCAYTIKNGKKTFTNKLLKESDIEYGTTLVNFANYP